MANAGMLAEIRETRRELARLNTDLARLGQNGAQGGKTFGQKFKAAALSGAKELGKGLMAGLGTGIGMGFGQVIGERIGQKLLSLGKKGGKSFGSGFKRAAKSEMESITAGSSLGGMKFNVGALPIIGAGVLAAGIASQVGSALGTAFSEEQGKISLAALAPGRGDQIFEELRSDALRTGKDVETMMGSVVKMLGLGFSPDDALAMNDAVLDLAGGLGMTAAEADLVVNAISQIKGKGKPAMEELRGQLGERAVPILEEIKNRYGANWEEMVQKGKVSTEEILSIFQNLEGALGKFKGGADRGAASGGGLFDRIKQQAIDLKRIFGAELVPELKPLMEDAIGFLVRMKEEAKQVGQWLADGLGTARAMLQELSFGEIFELAALKLKQGLIEALNFAVRGFGALLSTFQDGSMGDAMESAALRFREVMLLTMAEIARSLEEAAGADSKIGLMMGAAANRLQISGNVAGADRDALLAKNAGSPGFLEGVKKAFKEMPNAMAMSAEDLADMAEYDIRVRRRRGANLAAQSAGVPGMTPGATTTSTAMAGLGPAGGGLIAGGLANALSRISGGPSTILMTRQLEALKGVQSAVKQGVVAQNETTKAVQDLTRKVAVFS